jgi:AcrR family transcriptional regulator
MRQPAEDLGPRAHRTIARILDAARQVFLTNGYSGTTIDDIARVAEMSRASIYTYFPSKRDIMLATGARSATEAEAVIDRAVVLATSAEGTIQWVAEYFKYLELHGSFAFAWTEAAHDDDEIRHAGMKRHLKLCTRFGNALADAHGAKIADPTALGLAISSLFERSWSYGALYGPSMDAERLHVVIGQMIWSVVQALG